MAFLKDEQVGTIKEKMVNDKNILNKLYRSKKLKVLVKNISVNELEHYLDNGWEEVKALKTKVRIQKKKSHSQLFEDEVWCQFFQLGYQILNRDETLELPFSKKLEDKKQIDVIAINNETAFLIECKSSEKSKKAPSYKDEFDLLKHRLDGFRKAIKQIYGNHLKVKYIFATRNLRLDEDSLDMKRLKSHKVYYYNDNTYSYINSLIKNYKNAAQYQFLGLIFKNEKINDNRIEIPAIEGNMGGKKYYMFSIEPELLLKIGFILHRTKANDTEMPTYQRLLVPSRLKGITKFIDEGGYFPNSLIINFSKNKKIQFEASSRTENSDSRFGILKIPNEYSIAYIIDGQHRLYGYANSNFKSKNTIPVVGMFGLAAIEQLSIFMDINQNQKAVSPSLRLVLEEDLYWDSERLDSRLKALRSSIIKELSVGGGALSNKISIGEDSAELAFKPFATALLNCGLLPRAKGNSYIKETVDASLYDTHNLDNNKAMTKAKKEIIKLINMSYDFIEENYPNMYNEEKFIMSNRGTYAFIMILGSLHSYLFERKEILNGTSILDRFSLIDKYLIIIMEGLENLTTSDKEKYLLMKGAGADIAWFRLFQELINFKYPEYEPNDLIDWKERQDKKLQEKARGYIENIKNKIKKNVLIKLKCLFKENWELEINSFKRKSLERLESEKEKQYKEGITIQEYTWTDMLTILDYKSIIETYWSKKNIHIKGFQTFEKIFSISVEDNSFKKKDKVKWMTYLNGFNNTISNMGTKESGLNKDEVKILDKINAHFREHLI